MIKADDKIEFEGDNGKMEKEKYSHFEELQKRVEVLQRVIDEHAGILRQNNLVKTEKIDASYFDDDIVYKELEEKD